MVDVWQVCLMPDHIHMIVRINAPLPEGKHLGIIIGAFKGGVSRAWWRLLEEAKANASSTVPVVKTQSCAATVPVASATANRPPLFAPNYNDHILMRDGQLDNWKRYLDDNPRRLATKRQCPQFFTVMQQVNVAGQNCQMVGNRFLLDIPEKEAVIVHRAYTDHEYQQLYNHWLAVGEAGGVLVSAAIAPREKLVMREAMNRGYNIILLRENGFPKLYKPTGEAFNACTQGRLLQISPWDYHMERRTISREECLQLNSLAEKIAN
jgi:hypothetical protein